MLKVSYHNQGFYHSSISSVKERARVLLPCKHNNLQVLLFRTWDINTFVGPFLIKNWANSNAALASSAGSWPSLCSHWISFLGYQNCTYRQVIYFSILTNVLFFLKRNLFNQNSFPLPKNNFNSAQQHFCWIFPKVTARNLFSMFPGFDRSSTAWSVYDHSSFSPLINGWTHNLHTGGEAASSSGKVGAE